MFTFLLVVHAIIATALVAVILMQRSEGGGLASGNSSGLMTARGTADFLTRATSVLGTLFIVMSIGLAALASVSHGPTKIDTSLVGKTASPNQPAPPPADPLAAAAAQGTGKGPTMPTSTNEAAPATPAK